MYDGNENKYMYYSLKCYDRKHILNNNNISQNYRVYCIFDLIYAALVRII